MKSEKEIKIRVQSLIDKRIYEREKECLNVCPSNCKFNYKHKVSNVAGRVGFCNCPKVSTKKPFVCSHEDTAKQCEYFENIHTKESVRKDFMKILKDPAKVGQLYPRLAMLLMGNAGRTRC